MRPPGLSPQRRLHTAPCTRWPSVKSKQKPWAESKATFPPDRRTVLKGFPGLLGHPGSGDEGPLQAGRPPASPCPRGRFRARPPCPEPPRRCPERPGGMKFGREVGIRSRKESGPTCWEFAEAGPGLPRRATLAPSRHRGAAACAGARAAVFVLSAPHMV